jgi:hypothetical protein
MISDKIGLKLHDKFTRGQAMSDAEIRTLESWYAQKDMAEQRQILKQHLVPPAENALQEAIEETYQRLSSLTERLQATERENEQIRLENKRLRQKLENALSQPMA